MTCVLLNPTVFKIISWCIITKVGNTCTALSAVHTPRLLRSFWGKGVLILYACAESYGFDAVCGGHAEK